MYRDVTFLHTVGIGTKPLKHTDPNLHVQRMEYKPVILRRKNCNANLSLVPGVALPRRQAGGIPG